MPSILLLNTNLSLFDYNTVVQISAVIKTILQQNIMA